MTYVHLWRWKDRNQIQTRVSSLSLSELNASYIVHVIFRGLNSEGRRSILLFFRLRPQKQQFSRPEIELYAIRMDTRNFCDLMLLENWAVSWPPKIGQFAWQKTADGGRSSPHLRFLAFFICFLLFGAWFDFTECWKSSWAKKRKIDFYLPQLQRARGRVDLRWGGVRALIFSPYIRSLCFKKRDGSGTSRRQDLGPINSNLRENRTKFKWEKISRLILVQGKHIWLLL